MHAGARGIAVSVMEDFGNDTMTIMWVNAGKSGVSCCVKRCGSITGAHIRVETGRPHPVY